MPPWPSNRSREVQSFRFVRVLRGVIVSIILFGTVATFAVPTAHGPGRIFNEERLNQYRSQSEFRYDTPRFSASDALDQLISALWRKFFGYIFRAVNTTPGTIVLYALAAAAILYLLSKLFGNNVGNLLYQPARAPADGHAAAGDDIHALNLEALLEESIRERRYRDAVRILYLLTLRLLVEKHIVTWQRGKTNGEYSRELNQQLSIPFSEVTQIFEYLYYGDFPVDQPSFDYISGKFRSFQSLVGGPG